MEKSEKKQPMIRIRGANENRSSVGQSVFTV